MRLDLGKSALLLACLAAWVAIPTAYFAGGRSARDTADDRISALRHALEEADHERERLWAMQQTIVERLSPARETPEPFANIQRVTKTQPEESEDSSEIVRPTPENPVTPAAYDRIHVGMTYGSIVALLGTSETATVRSAYPDGGQKTMRVWRWTSSYDGPSEMTLQFLDGKLVSKECSALWAQELRPTPEIGELRPDQAD